MIETLRFKLIGIAPLMMHSERLANPNDAIAKEIKAITSRNKGKNKTEENDKEVMRLEWQGGLYLDEDGRPALPSDCLVATVKNAARKSKQGKSVESGMFCDDEFFPLEYEGPKDIETLWSSGRFLDYRSVGIQGKRVMRARPIFRHWSAVCSANVDAEQISGDDFRRWLDLAGTQIGICERRPRFGRFTVEML